MSISRTTGTATRADVGEESASRNEEEGKSEHQEQNAMCEETTGDLRCKVRERTWYRTDAAHRDDVRAKVTCGPAEKNMKWAIKKQRK